MSQDIPDWERPYFDPGGGNPFLYYTAFGNIPEKSLPGQHYRCAGIPEGCDLRKYDRDRDPAVIEAFMDGYLWDWLRQERPSLARDVSAASMCLVLSGGPVDPRTLNYLRDAVGLLTFFLDNGATALYDPQMFQFWSPEGWRSRIFDPAGPVPRHHVVILLSDEPDGTLWVHTRGMRKFGRPDISVRSVDRERLDGAVDLCNRFIEYQAFGGRIPEGKEIMMASLPPGGRAYHAGDLEDPDFNNVHIEIVWTR
ncbi:MAG TPA: hypothetical protein VJX67_22835 [Blastocatellia bacterium]|nr:hypothetical protein [Blastocatellia bacterium]